MTKSGFGEHLKREREMRGVSLDEVCAATRIGTRFLEALENEEWERLPGGVFNRGFVRSVAHFLGLDEDGLVAECALAMDEHNGTGGSKLHHLSATPSGGTSDRRKWLAVAVVLIFVMAVAAAAWFGWRWLGSRNARRLAQAQVQTSLTTAASDATTTANPSSGTGAPATPSAVTPSPVTPPPAASPGSTSGGPSASSGAGASPSKAPAAPNTGATIPTVVPPPSDMLQLKVEAGKDTRITISSDGKRVFRGGITAGQSRTFTARKKFDVRAQDAGAVLLELNGQTLGPIGPPGRSGKTALTRRDLKPAAGAPNQL
jgi:cytoskeleton protein RodZ